MGREFFFPTKEQRKGSNMHERRGGDMCSDNGLGRVRRVDEERNWAKTPGCRTLQSH